MYQEIFDERHQIIKISPDRKRKPNSISDGEYEPDILCEECDNILISGFETYASAVLHGGNVPVTMTNICKPDGLVITQVQGVDYAKFKLFLLSLLWRASISKRPFFDKVSLDARDEETIRKMLFDEKAGSQEAFPCVLSSSRRSEIASQMIVSPHRFSFNKKDGYAFLIAGMTYIFLVNEHEKTDWILEATVNLNGDMKIIHSTGYFIERQLNNIFGR